jgi:hypothetical protein
MISSESPERVEPLYEGERRVVASHGSDSPGQGFRHTFASLLLQQGESPAYVQRQLGHASIQLTAYTYGRWLPRARTARMARHLPRLGPMDRARSYNPVRQHSRRSRPTRCRTSVVASAAIVRPTGCSTTRSGGSGAIPVLPREGRAKKVYALITDWIAQIVKREWAESGPARPAGRPRERRREEKG